MRGGDIAAQRAVMAALVERVVPGRIERGKYDVEIARTPLGTGFGQLFSPARPHRAPPPFFGSYSPYRVEPAAAVWH
jgi:hypothetical protein